MLNDDAKDWVQSVLENRADKSWSPIVSMNAATAGSDTQIGDTAITISEDIGDGSIEISGVVDGEQTLMASYQFSIQ